MERRGIYTNPPKKGEPTTPGVLFSAFKSDLKKYTKEDVPIRSKSAEKKDERFAFKPASISIDVAFQPDKDIYGEDPKIIQTLIDQSLDVFYQLF
jgi:hypothetical protein